MIIYDYNASADKTYNVAQFISMRSTDSNTYYNYSIHNYLNGTEYAITNILYDYQDELDQITVRLRLTEKDFIKYRYRTNLLEYDIYGAEECDFIIYILNGILSPREFDFKLVKIILPSDLPDILGRIYSANDEFINRINSQLIVDEKADPYGHKIWQGS